MDCRGPVWKRVWKIWNRVRIWRTGRHSPTKNFQEYAPPPPRPPPPQNFQATPPPPPPPPARVNTLRVSSHLVEVQVYRTHMALGWSAFKDLPSDRIFLPPCIQSLSKQDLTEPRVLQLNQNKMTWFNLQLLKSCYIWEVHCKSCYASVALKLCVIDQIMLYWPKVRLKREDWDLLLRLGQRF